jgi:hypothetical protein
MFFTADMLIAHAIGDYVIQSDWMANEKTKKSIAAAAHAFTYTLPFLFITQSPVTLAFIMITHFIIDRWRLARYVCWAKNFLQPKTIVVSKETCDCDDIQCAKCHNSGEIVTLSRNYSWSECSATGYHKDRPAWLAVWLMIITDNIMHICLNAIAINFLNFDIILNFHIK